MLPVAGKGILRLSKAIDALLDHHADGEIVAILNARALKPGHAEKFNRLILFKLRQAHGLADRFADSANKAS